MDFDLGFHQKNLGFGVNERLEYSDGLLGWNLDLTEGYMVLTEGKMVLIEV